MERITESVVPTSDIVATTTMLDGFTLSQIDPLGGNTSHTREYSATGVTTTSTTPRATTYDYLSFGGVAATGSKKSPVQWSAEVYDEELTLGYYNYRHFNPQDGRWINRDPIGIKGGLNLYGFVGNRATSYIDVKGENHAVVAGGVGVGYGLAVAGEAIADWVNKVDDTSGEATSKPAPIPISIVRLYPTRRCNKLTEAKSKAVNNSRGKSCKHTKIPNTVERLCCEVFLVNATAFSITKDARDLFQAECFDQIDGGHKTQIDQMAEGYTTCRNKYNECLSKAT